MKVRITKCPNVMYWYSHRIGEVFNVTKDNNGDYATVKNDSYIDKKDCEVIPWFSIGSKVIVRDGSDDDGRTGVICGTGDVFPWRVRYDSDGETELFFEGCLELVTEDPWMSKEAACKLCIDGAKVMSAEPNASTVHYMDFNGINFVWHHGRHSGIVNTMPTKFKLWTPPTPPKPKFSAGSFVIDECGDYGRIVTMEFAGGSWLYSLSDCVDDDCPWDCDESELTAV